MLVSAGSRCLSSGMLSTYCVGSSKFLLSTNDSTRPLGCVEGRLAFDDTLPVNSCAASSTDLAANSCDLIPILVGHSGSMIGVEVAVSCRKAGFEREGLVGSTKDLMEDVDVEV